MLSLHNRLLVAATLVLTAFFGLTGWALDHAYGESVETAMRERIEAHVYTVLAAAKEDAQGHMRLPDSLPDPRFNTPDSGLYAQLVSANDDYRWSSPSTLGRTLAVPDRIGPGKRRFSRVQSGDSLLLVLSFGLGWEDLTGQERRYTLAVAQDLSSLQQQIADFRGSLWLWLGAAAVLLLLVQGGVLRWSLRPLRQASTDLQRIESGEQERLAGHYPRELRGLTRNINSLIEHGRATQQRYRNSLADLAHSLKTPLAVLQAARQSGDADQLQTAADEQVPHIDRIIHYQLERASVMGRADISRAVLLKPIAEKIAASLHKIYREKDIQFTLKIPDTLAFRGDEGDLYELLGNLLDNAFKYAAGTVAMRAENTGNELTIVIEDDGPGIAAEQAETLTQRGVRGDQAVPGQGIGLSVVKEIVTVYGGILRLAPVAPHGTRVQITVPQSSGTRP